MPIYVVRRWFDTEATTNWPEMPPFSPSPDALAENSSKLSAPAQLTSRAL